VKFMNSNASNEFTKVDTSKDSIVNLYVPDATISHVNSMNESQEISEINRNPNCDSYL
jgi:hypothetical protein